jgi:hypothetical protein
VHKHKNNLRGENTKNGLERKSMGRTVARKRPLHQSATMAKTGLAIRKRPCWHLYEPYRPVIPPIKAEDEAVWLAEQKTLLEEQLKAMQETLKKIQE